MSLKHPLQSRVLRGSLAGFVARGHWVYREWETDAETANLTVHILLHAANFFQLSSVLSSQTSVTHSDLFTGPV